MRRLSDAAFTHVGGAVVSDHGPIPLAAARALAAFYAREARSCLALDARLAARLCARRALALDRAATDAARWRRAAGWHDPDAADGPFAGACPARPSTRVHDRAQGLLGGAR